MRSIMPVALLVLGIAGVAHAQPSITVITPPFIQPGGPQMGGMPYRGPGFTIYPPGSPVIAPTLGNGSLYAYPPGAQTCVATPYTCPAPAPNTLGDACACPTNAGGTIQGVVR